VLPVEGKEGTNMKNRIAIALAAVFLAVGGGLATATHAAPQVVAKRCSAGYVHARLSWGEKCLRAGEFCKIGNREYLRYGFYCPATGHLRRR
jgi:hypothetical protein